MELPYGSNFPAISLQNTMEVARLRQLNLDLQQQLSAAEIALTTALDKIGGLNAYLTAVKKDKACEEDLFILKECYCATLKHFQLVVHENEQLRAALVYAVQRVGEAMLEKDKGPGNAPRKLKLENDVCLSLTLHRFFFFRLHAHL